MAYIAPIHRPSSVRHAIKLSFLGPESDDLIVAKANRLEIYTPDAQTPTRLVLQHTKSIYGKVTLLQKLRPVRSATDHVFIGTDRYHYFTLSWDPTNNSLKTEKSYVDVSEQAARDSQTGDRVHIDPSSRFLTIEMYEGVVTVIPIAHAKTKGKRKESSPLEIGELGEPMPLRIPELFVKSSCFLHKRSPSSKLPHPELAVLYEDGNRRMRIKVRKLEKTSNDELYEFDGGQDVSGEVELGATILIALPPPIYGMVVVGDTSISYIDEFDHRVQSREPLQESTVFVAWCQVDVQRYVLADDYGRLYLLFVDQNFQGEYSGHRIDVLGETSRASTLVYLDGGRIFVGSHQGDSQIIQIKEQGLAIVQTFPNIAPVLDFTIMDMGNRSADAPVNEFSSGQARIVTGSGAFKDGSLRSVRSGVGLEDLGSIGNMGAPVSAVFSLRSSPLSSRSDVLLVTFVAHTRVFYFNADGDVEELESFRSFRLSETTLHAASLKDGRAIQVTNTSAILAGADSSSEADVWQPSGGRSITSAASSGSLLVVSIGGAALVSLGISGSSITQTAQREFGNDEQVSCVALSSSLSEACIVGFWKDSKVSLLRCSDLSTIATEVADPETLAIPRSLLVANILPDQPAVLFIGLADGNVVTYTITPTLQHPFSSRKSMILGTQQPNFAALPRGDGLENVFATCENPSLIYGSEGRMVYSAITAENAASICAFDNEAYPGAIAIATLPRDAEDIRGEGTELKLALVDEERTTHIQPLPINQTVRRIAYSPELKAFGLGCIQRTLSAGVEEVKSCFQLVDEVAFSLLHAYDLNEDELIEAVIRCQLSDGTGELVERFVVGTAYLDDSNPADARGRILVFEVTEDRQLKLVTERDVRGAVRCLGMCRGRLVAALLKTVVMYSFEYETPSQPFLVKKAAFRVATAPIDLSIDGNFVAVTDLMKSVTLMEFVPGTGGRNDKLVEKARHNETVWGTAVAKVAEQTWLESDAEGNLLVMEYWTDGFGGEERRSLRVTSEFLLGEMVNRIRPVTVQPSASAVVVPAAFLATVEGGIYLFALIAPDKRDLLIQLQDRMAEVVKSPGHVPFGNFRGFRNAVRSMKESGPQRFVDGELVEKYLDAPAGVQETVASQLNIEVENLKGIVEALKRVH